MKRLLSLFLVVVMLFAALAMVACGGDPEETTTQSTTTSNTTASSTTETTTEATTTTETTTTETTTTETTTTTTTETTTTETTTTTTTETTASETTTTSGTIATVTSGTSEGVYARFDFGTKTEAEANNLTSHEYLTSHLSYNSSYLWIDYDEDNIIVYATQDYNYSTMQSSRLNYALVFDDISADYTFEDPQEIHCGFGTWDNYPYSSANVGVEGKWKGFHQYIKIRFVNASPNTKIGFWYKSTSLATYYTTAVACIPVTPGKANSDYLNNDANYQVVIYDILNAMNLATGANELTPDNGKGPGNNWIWQGASQYVTGLRFHLLGNAAGGNARGGATFAKAGNNKADDGTGNMIAADGSGKVTSWSANEALTSAKALAALDTRGLIKAGNAIKVDYIVFGSSPDQLLTYKSAAEKAYEASK